MAADLGTGRCITLTQFAIMRGVRGRMPAATRTVSTASLSVVLLSNGRPTDSQRAALAVRGASRDFGAQVILVSRESDPALVAMFENSGTELVLAPPGSTRAEMCDLGMNRARGTIVAVRDDAEVGDARWLDAYVSVLPTPEPAAQDQAFREVVVMDSMRATNLAVADVTASFGVLESRSRVATIEMAAAV